MAILWYGLRKLTLRSVLFDRIQMPTDKLNSVPFGPRPTPTRSRLQATLGRVCWRKVLFTFHHAGENSCSRDCCMFQAGTLLPYCMFMMSHHMCTQAVPAGHFQGLPGKRSISAHCLGRILTGQRISQMMQSIFWTVLVEKSCLPPGLWRQ